MYKAHVLLLFSSSSSLTSSSSCSSSTHSPFHHAALCSMHPMRALFLIPRNPPPRLKAPKKWLALISMELYCSTCVPVPYFPLQDPKVHQFH